MTKRDKKREEDDDPLGAFKGVLVATTLGTIFWTLVIWLIIK